MKIASKQAEFLMAYIVLTLTAASFISYALDESLKAVQEYFINSGISF